MDARLVILGALRRGPMHGYELKRVFEQSRVDQWAGLLKGSIYHALKQMTAEGLLKVKEPEAGSDPRVKSVYELTPRGRAEFKALLKRAWAAPIRGFPTTLFAAVAYLSELEPELVLQALDKQCAQVETELQRWRQGERAKTDGGQLAPHTRLLFEAARQHLETDLRLLENVRWLVQGTKHRP